MSQPRTTVKEAHELIERRTPSPNTETRPVEETTGYVLAESVEATEPVQPFRNAAMDGFAVRFEEAKSSQERPLRIAGEVAAGDPGTMEVNPGECVGIMTGAPVPEGLDTVIRIEDCVVEGDTVRFTRMPSRGKGDNVRDAGEDIQIGDTVLRSDRVIRPYELGVAVLAGRRELKVYRRPRVAIISTGDELVETPGAPLEPGQIRDINRFTLAEAARQAGARVGHVSSLPDDLDRSIERIQALFADNDVVVTSGGISMGEYDFIGDVMDRVGVELVFHKVWQKPGKPLGFGARDDTLFFALPGNVVSSTVNFELYVRPVLLRLRGLREVQRDRFECVATEPFGETDRRTFFFRGVLERTSEGPGVRPTGTGQGSHIMTSMSEADCLVEVPPNTTVEEGDVVTVIDLNHPLPLPLS